MGEELGQHLPLEGAVRFYQAVERFAKYCALCKTVPDAQTRLMVAGQARENLDAAYAEFLLAFPLLLPLSDGTRPMPTTGEVTTEELRATFEKQVKALDGNRAREILARIDRIRSECPGDGCALQKCGEDAQALLEFAGKVKKGAETFFLEDVLGAVKKQLEAAARDPEAFRSMLPLPPRPLMDDYRS